MPFFNYLVETRMRCRSLLPLLLLLCIGCTNANRPDVQDLLLEVVIKHGEHRESTVVSAAFSTADKEALSKFHGVALKINGMHLARDPYHRFASSGKIVVGYEFEGIFDRKVSDFDIVLVREPGDEYRRNVTLLKYSISGLPAKIDRTQNIVLNYTGAPLGPDDLLVIWAAEIGKLGSVVGEWRALNTTTLEIPSDKLKSLPLGPVEFSFHRHSKRRFDGRNTDFVYSESTSLALRADVLH